MWYNATYGCPCNDSMSMYEIPTKHSETLNLFETDCNGVLHVKKEFAYCDRCGKKLEETETTYLHGNKRYCKDCEKKERLAQRRNKYKQTKKAVKK